jgi:hypothetical protein
MSFMYMCPLPLTLLHHPHPLHPPWCPAADANILINMCRTAAQRYFFAYQEPMPVEQLVRAVCDTKQVRGAAGPGQQSRGACREVLGGLRARGV